MKIEPYDNLSLSENQLKVLKHLSEMYGSDYNCTYFRVIAKSTGIEERLVRLACRALARKGYTEYVRGLFDDDGQTAGSGYCCTQAGNEVIERIEEYEKAKTTIL